MDKNVDWDSLQKLIDKHDELVLRAERERIEIVELHPFLMDVNQAMKRVHDEGILKQLEGIRGQWGGYVEVSLAEDSEHERWVYKEEAAQEMGQVQWAIVLVGLGFMGVPLCGVLLPLLFEDGVLYLSFSSMLLLFLGTVGVGGLFWGYYLINRSEVRAEDVASTVRPNRPKIAEMAVAESEAAESLQPLSKLAPTGVVRSAIPTATTQKTYQSSGVELVTRVETVIYEIINRQMQIVVKVEEGLFFAVKGVTKDKNWFLVQYELDGEMLEGWMLAEMVSLISPAVVEIIPTVERK